MMVTIIPHGALRASWPKGFTCDVATPAEALRALQTQFGIKRAQVRIAGCPTQASLLSPLQEPELHVVPDLSGGGGAMKIVIGVLIVVAAILLSPYTVGASLNFIPVGLSLVLGGILELMSPSPKTDKDPAVSSKFLSNPKNTTKIGTRIPMGYGRFPAYGHYISFGIAAVPSATALDASAKRKTQGLGN